jgi:hypothetical protein
MKKILVNAASCKLGGARQIAEQFVRQNSDKYQLIVLAPRELNLELPSSQRINFETKGIGTLFFSLFGIIYYVMKFKPHSIISFSNINIFLPLVKRYTYFHNIKILTNSALKYKIFRLVINLFLLKKNTFIFQTSYVDTKFREFYPTIHSQISWPGVSSPPQFCSSFKKISSKGYKAIIPYAYVNLPQKNFDFFQKFDWSKIKNLSEILVVTNSMLSAPFNNVGSQSREGMNKLYESCDLLLVSSLEETVCLPIFEFACTGKPVLVLNAGYTCGLRNDLDLPKNIIFFDEVNFDVTLNNALNDYLANCLNNNSDLDVIINSHWPKLTNQ